MNPRQLLIDEWPTVENLIKTTARKRKLQDAEIEELASAVKIKLFENDCAVIRNFRGESKLSTYLHVLVDRAALDICTKRMGKWHPSATATRLGPVAVELEQLIYRSGFAPEEAIAALQRKRPEVGIDELNALVRLIPQRKPRDGRTVALQTIEHALHDDEEADVLVIAEERSKISEHAAEIVRRQLSSFEDVDRLVFQMRFERNMRLSDIARMLGVDPPGALYRRHQDLLRTLRRAMESDGITASEVADLIGHLSEQSDFGLKNKELCPSDSATEMGVPGEIRR